MSYICDKCSKKCRDNYDLTRHRSKKTPCKSVVTLKDTSGVTFNITVNQQNNIKCYGLPPTPACLPKCIVDRAIGMFDEDQPMYTTAKGVVFVRKFLNTNPENRNVNVDPKSAIGTVYNGNTWQRAVKSDIVDHSIKQTARALSDSIDIVGVDCPDQMTESLECLVMDATQHLTNQERKAIVKFHDTQQIKLVKINDTQQMNLVNA